MGGRTRTKAHRELVRSGAQSSDEGAHKRRRSPPRTTKRDPLPPPCDVIDNEGMGYLDADRLDAWEDNLKGKQLRDWNDFKGIMRRSDRNMRSCIMAFVLQDELNRARDKFLRARNMGEPFKAVLLTHNGREAMERIRRLDAKVFDVLDLSRQLQRAVSLAEHAYGVVNVDLKRLAKLAGHWHDAAPGAAKDEGLAAAAEKSLGLKDPP